MAEKLQQHIRALWERAFNERDLEALDAVTAPGFVNPTDALPELAVEEYPAFVNSEAEKRRWRISLAVARELFGKSGEGAV